jgi:hypothetical protein
MHVAAWAQRGAAGAIAIDHRNQQRLYRGVGAQNRAGNASMLMVDLEPTQGVHALFSSEVSLTQEMLLWEDGAEAILDTRDPEDDAASALDSLTTSTQAGDR